MELNKEMTKKYKKILKSMPSFTEQGWNENDKWDIKITGLRIYQSSCGSYRSFEVDIEYSGTFRWSWGSVRSKNNTIRNATEKTLKRYFAYLGIDLRFNYPTRFFENTGKIKKIKRINQSSPSIGG